MANSTHLKKGGEQPLMLRFYGLSCQRRSTGIVLFNRMWTFWEAIYFSMWTCNEIKRWHGGTWNIVTTWPFKKSKKTVQNSAKLSKISWRWLDGKQHFFSIKRLWKTVIVSFRRKLLRGDIISMYKVKNLERKIQFLTSISGAQNFRQLKEGLYIYTYALHEDSGIY